MSRIWLDLISAGDLPQVETLYFVGNEQNVTFIEHEFCGEDKPRGRGGRGGDKHSDLVWMTVRARQNDCFDIDIESSAVTSWTSSDPAKASFSAVDPGLLRTDTKALLGRPRTVG